MANAQNDFNLELMKNQKYPGYKAIAGIYKVVFLFAAPGDPSLFCPDTLLI